MTENVQGSMGPLERRLFARASFFFKVRFQLLSEVEFEKARTEWAERASMDRKSLKFLELDADTAHEAPPWDPHLWDFLLHLDDKIDRLLAHLIGEGHPDQRMEEGTGLDVGGGGMRVMVEHPLSVGQRLQADLLLTRVPFVRVHIFGEVVRVAESFREQGVCWEAGVQFLDLDSEERERIIACVFQRQREVLRKRKGKEWTHEEVVESTD
jgi:hypothetical protein